MQQGLDLRTALDVLAVHDDHLRPFPRAAKYLEDGISTPAQTATAAPVLERPAPRSVSLLLYVVSDQHGQGLKLADERLGKAYDLRHVPRRVLVALKEIRERVEHDNPERLSPEKCLDARPPLRVIKADSLPEGHHEVPGSDREFGQGQKGPAAECL